MRRGVIDDLPCLMYLLAHDDAADGPYDRSRTGLLVRAAALVDLALRGRLREDGGAVTVSGTEPTGDPVLDGVLRDAAGGHGWKHLVRRHRKRTLTEVEDRLAAAGLLTSHSPAPLSAPGADRDGPRRDRRAPRPRVRGAARDGPVQEIPAADAALLALAAAGRIRSVVSRQDRKIFRARIDACTGSSPSSRPAWRKPYALCRRP